MIIRLMGNICMSPKKYKQNLYIYITLLKESISSSFSISFCHSHTHLILSLSLEHRRTPHRPTLWRIKRDLQRNGLKLRICLVEGGMKKNYIFLKEFNKDEQYDSRYLSGFAFLKFSLNDSTSKIPLPRFVAKFFREMFN